MSSDIANIAEANVSVDQALHVSTHRLTGWVQWSGNAGTVTWGFRTGLDASSTTETNVSSSTNADDTISNFTSDIAFSSDTGYVWRTKLTGYFVGNAPLIAFRSYAVTATASTPTSSAIDTTIATIACNYFPNTSASVATAWLEYRQFGSSTWIVAGSPDTGQSGYSVLSLSRNLTGLTPSTTYEYRLSLTRNTSNAMTLSSSTATFTTSAATPTITTNAASNIGTGGATLNGTINPNGLSSTYAFVWGATLGGPYPNTTATQGPSSGSADIVYSAPITGLSTSTAYYYKAKATYSGTDYYGSEIVFTTEADATEAPNLQIHRFEGQYGVQSTYYFTVLVPSATNSNRFFNAAVPWIAGDVKVVIDGGTPANIGTLPTRVGTSPVYTLTLTAGEMTGTDIQVYLVDADGPAWRDTILHVQTKLRIGQIHANASQIGSSASAVLCQPSAGGYGLSSVDSTNTFAGRYRGVFTDMILASGTAQAGGAASVTLASGASATNDYYNGSAFLAINGTGSGQFRIITDYDGSTKVATLNRSWATNPDSTTIYIIVQSSEVWDLAPSGELSALPTSTSTFGKFMQFFFQRFAYKRVQTATTFTMYKADSSTSLTSGSVSDDGTSETASKLS